MLTSIIFVCCLCFSLVLCSHLVAYPLLHVEPVDLTWGEFSAKLPFGENSDSKNSVWRSFCSAKILLGENSVRRKLLRRKPFRWKFLPPVNCMWFRLMSLIVTILLLDLNVSGIQDTKVRLYIHYDPMNWKKVLFSDI